MMRRLFPIVCVALALAASAAAQGRLQSSDLFKLRSVGNVQWSPDGSRIAYTITSNDGPGGPYSQLWILNVPAGQSVRVGDESSRGSQPVWSPDGRSIAYIGSAGGKSGLIICAADGSGSAWKAEVLGTNSSALTNTGRTIAWAPDSKTLAYVHATPGPETADATGDPMLITRFLYKPTASEGNTRFNDNRRLHIFLLDTASGRSTQLTDGVFDEHSIDWAPAGDEILFVSNREPDADQFFNNDIFSIRVSSKEMRRLTTTESAEYWPTWSPDGKQIAFEATKRGLTDLETQMEDTHVWTMGADGGHRREVGGAIDNRQGPPQWSADGGGLFFTAQERGLVRLYRIGADGSGAQAIVAERGTVGQFDLGPADRVAYTFTSVRDMSQLYQLVGTERRAMTDLNKDVLAGKTFADVEPFTFVSNDNKFNVEAFLTRPLGQTAGSKHPLIVMIHGGPHGQQGPAFNFQSQVYAARGWATLQVNYRGSTGYGQAFTDGVFRDQNGDEAQDVLYGVNAAIRRNPWIDRERLGIEGGSYGGQLTAWLITQTHIFKAAIPNRAIINLVSYNYMTYYNQYEEMEFGMRPHQADLMDELWRRSALRYVAQVKTPTLLIHGENDNDVPIAEAEQFYIALKDVGVEAAMLRYPREGHGLREPKHVVDSIDRSIAWYERFFARR
ncbi:MAG TPA: S9 family peptidase [Vicinamibacterales bacterium]|nr:S9 family peptidase [Vicinamibacterales bacterium]